MKEVVDFVGEENEILGEIIVNQDVNVDEAVRTRICTAILYSPRITSIKIESVTLNTQLARWIARYRRMENLTKLEFQGFVTIPNKGDARSIAYMLQTNTTLQELSLFALYSDTTKLFLEALAQSSRTQQASLKKLSVKCCYSTHDCFIAIGHVLERYPLLETLDLMEGKNELGDTAAIGIAQGIETSASLTAVTINVKRLSAVGAERILRSCASKSTLKAVCLGSIPSNEACFIAAARVIEANESIEKFSMTRSPHRLRLNTQPMDMAVLGEALALNQSLNALTLNGFGIDAEGIKRLCAGLLRNETLQSLSFCGNTINEEGMQLLCGLISHSRCLKNLDLSRNGFSCSTIELLCQAMESNETVEHLNLYSNDISENCVNRIGKMLLRNKNLETLRLWTVGKLSESCVRTLIEGVQTHPTISLLQILLKNNMTSGDPDLLRRELDFYLELNKGPKRILNEDTDLHIGLWPLILKRADDHGRTTARPPDVLHFFVKEKCDLFCIT